MSLSELPAANSALLIDGENISSTWAGRMIVEASKTGTLLIKRAFGNATRIKGWDEAPGIKLIHTGSGKNAADIALAIEAVELSFSGRVSHFVLASSDGDFSHLATFLRERGHHVVGMGEKKAPANFRKSCSRWHVLEAKPLDMDQKIHAELRKQQGGLLIQRVSPTLRASLGVTLSDLDEKTWRKYFEKRPEAFKISGEAQQTLITTR